MGLVHVLIPHLVVVFQWLVIAVALPTFSAVSSLHVPHQLVLELAKKRVNLARDLTTPVIVLVLLMFSAV